MINLILLVLFNISMVFSQFLWQDGGLPLRQGAHIEWQRTGAVASDGSMIIAWSDTRQSIRDIYAQKIDSEGNYLWDVGGAVVVNCDGRQEDPLLVSDQNGGAYIIWRDYRDENYYGDIYAQHIDSEGNRSWDIDGVALSNDPGEQSAHNLCIDGEGGAFAVWMDKNGSGTYVGTHLGVNQDDIIAPGTGVLVASSNGGSFSLEYAFYDKAVMVWKDNLVDDLRAQSFDQEMDMLWNEDGGDNGKIICDADELQHKAKVTTWGDDAVAVVWRDLRNDDDGDVYAQILDSSANNMLEENGKIVCDNNSQQASPRVKTNGTYAFIYWEDKRNGEVDPYVQKMDNIGNLLWENNGAQVVDNPFEQSSVRMSPDSNGGAYFVWSDKRGEDTSSGGGDDIYAQHVDSDGNLTFSEGGLEIDTDGGAQYDPLIKSNDSGEAFIVWRDQKNGSDDIIEVQKLTLSGVSFEDNGQEVFYGQDGNAFLSSSLQISDGEALIAWEDQRYFSTGHPGCYTYGLIVDEYHNTGSHGNAVPLSLNQYQGPHDENYQYRAKLSKSGSSIMMNFNQYYEGYSQYIQMIDEDLSILGDNLGTAIDNSGDDQPYSAICEADGEFYVAYTNLISGYGINLQKYNSSGEELWGSPINIVEPTFGDNLVKEIISNGNGVAVIYETSSFLGTELKVIFVESNGAISSQHSWCGDCSNPQYESYAKGDNEFIITFKNSSSDLAAGVFAQIFSYDGEMLGGDDGVLVADAINDQRESDLTYNSVFDEYLACWDDSRELSVVGYECDQSQSGYDSLDECELNCEGSCTAIEATDKNVLCAKLTYDESLLVSDEIEVASINLTAQENPSVFSTHAGTYMIAWQDMRNAVDIDQSLNLSFEWDAYYQELNSSGFVYADGGIPISTDPFQQVRVQFNMLSEDDNLYIISWEDDRSTGKELITNIYAQLVSPSLSCLPMDVNSDSYIDVLDIVLIVNIVLGNIDPDISQQCASDVNGDGGTDVLDVVATVNHILNS